MVLEMEDEALIDTSDEYTLYSHVDQGCRTSGSDTMAE